MHLTLDLPAELSTQLQTHARSQGVSPSQIVLDTLRHAFPNGTAPTAPEGVAQQPTDLARNHKHYLYGHPKEETALLEEEDPLLALFARATANIPPEVVAQQPTDLARNYKHYLYGNPKEEE